MCTHQSSSAVHLHRPIVLARPAQALTAVSAGLVQVEHA